MNLPRAECWQHGHWRPWTHPVFPGPKFVATAALACPRCGHLFVLSSEVHTIASDGGVTPSVVCPHKDCSFHEFVVLTGWKLQSIAQST